jgi:hypothetical protein
MANELELDLDSVDLDDMDLDNIDLTDFGEVDETIDYPHIKVGSKALKEFLKVSKKVCASGGKDIISKATCLVYDESKEKVVAYATDFDVYVQQDLEVLNTTNLLKEPVIVPTDVLIKLTSAVPANTIFYKKDDTFYIRLYGGDMELEAHAMSLDKFQFLDEVERVETIEASSLYSVMKDFSPVVAAAVNPAEKRIICGEDGAFANYMFAIMKATSVKGSFDLKSKDLEILKGLVVNKKEEDLVLYRTKEDVKVARCLVEGSDFKYAFLVSEATMSDSLKNNMNNVLTQEGVFVDFIQLYKMIELASELPYALGKVGINYTENGLVIDIKTKKGLSNVFEISGSIDGAPDPLKEELVVQAKLLKILLRSFASKQSVKVSLTKDGLGLVCDDYSAAIYSEAE